MRINDVYYHVSLDRIFIVIDEFPLLKMFLVEHISNSDSILCVFEDDDVVYLGEL